MMQNLVPFGATNFPNTSGEISDCNFFGNCKFALLCTRPRAVPWIEWALK